MEGYAFALFANSGTDPDLEDEEDNDIEKESKEGEREEEEVTAREVESSERSISFSHEEDYEAASEEDGVEPQYLLRVDSIEEVDRTKTPEWLEPTELQRRSPRKTRKGLRKPLKFCSGQLPDIYKPYPTLQCNFPDTPRAPLSSPLTMFARRKSTLGLDVLAMRAPDLNDLKLIPTGYDANALLRKYYAIEEQKLTRRNKMKEPN